MTLTQVLALLGGGGVVALAVWAYGQVRARRNGAARSAAIPEAPTSGVTTGDLREQQRRADAALAARQAEAEARVAAAKDAQALADIDNERTGKR